MFDCATEQPLQIPEDLVHTIPERHAHYNISWPAKLNDPFAEAIPGCILRIAVTEMVFVSLQPYQPAGRLEVLTDALYAPLLRLAVEITGIWKTDSGWYVYEAKFLPISPYDRQLLCDTLQELQRKQFESAWPSRPPLYTGPVDYLQFLD